MQEPEATLSDALQMADVVKIFENTHADYLPVVDKDRHLRGYISRQRMYTQYRKMVADMSED